MPIAFCITDTGQFHCDLEATSIDDETFHWLSLNHIDLGRKEFFHHSIGIPEIQQRF